MATQALYLKYRPQTFEDVAGQEPITTTLRNALRQGRLRHAYLFAGPRGTGKTTTARLLAKAANCLAPEGQRPCNACSVCVAINEGRFLDLIEVDAASNRGIDEIRDIREKVGFRPNEGRFKVYVLDEAHMLTEPAFNALLKTLEEPPPHVIFALVTTDPHKIPATIVSRCQRFDFRRISLQTIVERLATIAHQEGVTVEPAALELIARQATGAMRDAISLLDQLASYGDEITLGHVQMVLGAVASDAAGKLAEYLASGDVPGGLDLINRTIGDGADPRQFGREVVEYLRGLLLLKEGAGTRLLNATSEQAAEMEALSGRMPMARLLQAIKLFNGAATDLRGGLQTIPQLPLEMALVESILEPGFEAPGSAAEGHTEPAAPAPRAESRGSGSHRVAEQTAPPPSVTPVAHGPDPEPGERASGEQNSAGQLSLAEVEKAWQHILQAVRQRNPATQGVLNTDCKPVEVNESEIVITFPHVFMRKLLDVPQRKEEIQDALTEVLNTRCRLRLVLASEYAPHAQAPRAGSDVAAQQAPSASEVPGPISQWAKQHGGQARLVES
jgi:DNA polymerase-3 subunit gamma/tau